MSTPWYSDEEVQQYFQNRQARHTPPPEGSNGRPSRRDQARQKLRGLRARMDARYPDEPKKAQAAYVLSIVLMGLGVFAALGVVAFVLMALTLPSLSSIERPVLNRATTAYTADGKELARYYLAENRVWVPFDSIATPVVEALVATEDERFYQHWGVDVKRTLAIPYHVLRGNPQGGSTITQQLARNLYNIEQVEGEGNRFRRSPTRKIKEMMTAVMIERRYTKREIIEMYLNTVEFGNNSSGIQAASRAFYSKNAADLDLGEAATLVGMLQAPTRYNPVRNPQNAQRRRNIVMGQMVRNGVLTRAEFDEWKDAPIVTKTSSSELVESIAPYFAMAVRDWLRAWGRESGHDIYKEGLIVTTTLDSRMQAEAERAVRSQMRGLQAVVDNEWGRGTTGAGTLEGNIQVMRGRNAPEPFARFWADSTRIVDDYVRKSSRYIDLTRGRQATDEAPAVAPISEAAAMQRLKGDEAFMDSLRYLRTRLEASFLAVDPHTGQVRAWVGGRTIEGAGTRSDTTAANVGPRARYEAAHPVNPDWFDHVITAKRQPGSTFKPFVYLAAIDNGYSPDMSIGGGPFRWVGTGPCRGQSWAPTGGGGNKTLRAALATSDNYVTGRLMTRLNPRTVVMYARRMGITSDLIPEGVRAECYMSLALGTSDVSLYELSSAYATLANGGLHNPPVMVTRIEDRRGNILYQATPTPREAVSEETAFTVVDMMRGAVDYGTARSLPDLFGLQGYDFAAKTGTTQEGADGWLMLMHPDLVVGSWVGFNDRRIAFRSAYWGQGAHNALYLTGDFLRRLKNHDEIALDREATFPDVDFEASLEAIPVGDAPEATQATPPPRERTPTTRPTDETPTDEPSRQEW